MKDVNVKTIPHRCHRYNTVGDYWDAGESIEVRVSRMADWRHEALVVVHELVEKILCMHRGISDDAVTAFDVTFEATRREGDHSEPGDQLDAPYRHEHLFASAVERLLASELGVDWAKYEEEIHNL